MRCQLRRRKLRPHLLAAAVSGATLSLRPAAGRILDNLPVAMVRMRHDDGAVVKTYERGFPVGFKAAVEEARSLA